MGWRLAAAPVSSSSSSSSHVSDAVVRNLFIIISAVNHGRHLSPGRQRRSTSGRHASNLLGLVGLDLLHYIASPVRSIVNTARQADMVLYLERKMGRNRMND